MTVNNEYCPSSNVVKDNWIPEKLKMFLSFFTTSELKQESIGKTIVKLSSPNQIPPILFALSVEMDNLFGSRWLIYELYKLGFGMSYNEVIRFKQACVINESSVLELPSTSNSQGFMQFIADNVDHNIVTFNGEGTFHGMGILSATVGNGKFNTEVRLKRPSKLVKIEDLMSKSPAISIRDYIAPERSKFTALKLKPMVELMSPYVLPKSVSLDIKWKIATLFSKPERPCPNWNGYMQLMTEDNHSQEAIFTFHLIINMNPSNYTCIYTTLCYIEDQCQKLDIQTPSVTFDQPLWLKATEIVIEKSMNMVVHLGGFHTLMSYLGSIGSVMDASGLKDVLQTVYGENTVKHMLGGKAITRAVRGHILVENALHLKLQNMLFDETSGHTAMTQQDMQELEEALGGNEDISELEVIKKLLSCEEELKRQLCEKSRTARLWL